MMCLTNIGLFTRQHFARSVILLCLLFSASHLQAANKPITEPTTDLRILVDVSGSMKLNDPKNLRRDALRLLIGMLPKTSRVGIWSFGQYVNMQVKPDFATKQWKEKALKEANKVHSLGLYTNIQDTLTKSSWDWRRPDPKWDRHMILLTDGMVDISKNPSKNETSRQKILGKILDDLKSANVKVHTIALSSQADHELLKKLAKKSDGWYESVDSADKLQRIFLRLFEKTAKMDSLPLEGNYFEVDKSISDMTLLVFRSKSGVETKIKHPDGTVFGKSKIPDNVEWYTDKSFDIVTVHKPKVGRWKLEADIDKDNRVKVVTNLKLRIDSLPSNIIKDEAVNVKASLLTSKGLLDDKALLNLIKLSANSTAAKGEKSVQNIPQVGESATYEKIIDGVNEVGDMQIIVRANSPTFKRESRHEIKVHENPVRLDLFAAKEGLVISVTEDPALLQAGTLQLALGIEGQPGAYKIPKDGEHRWKAVIDNSFAGKAITINATATTIENIKYSSQLHGKMPMPIIPPADPLKVWAENSDAGLVVKAMLTENLLKIGSLNLEYYVEGLEDKQGIISKNEAGNIWQQLLPDEYSEKNLLVKAQGVRLSGEPFNKSYEIVVPKLEIKAEEVISEPAEVVEKPVEVVEEPAKVVEEPNETVEKESIENNEPLATGKNEDDESISILSIVIILVVNILVMAGGYFGYRYWLKDNKGVDDDLFEEIGDDSIPVVTEVVEENESDTVSDGLDDEDFSSQRKEKPELTNVDLDLDEGIEVTEIEMGADEIDAIVEGSKDDDVLEESSADDLPEFDIESDLDSDVSETVEEDAPDANEDVISSEDDTVKVNKDE